MEGYFHIFIVIMLHTGFALAVLHWHGASRFARLFAGAWLIEAVRAAILLPDVHHMGGLANEWFCLADLLNLVASWMILASGAELTSRRIPRWITGAYFGLSIPLLLAGRYVLPLLLQQWFQLPPDRALFLAVFVNLLVMFGPIAVIRLTVVWWLFRFWQQSKLSGALIAFIFGLPYAFGVFLVPAQYYYSWYPLWVRFFWCLHLFGFSLGILMLLISRAEQQRRQRDAIYQSLFEQNAFGVGLFDGIRQRALRLNSRLIELYNLPPSQWMSADLRLFVGEEIGHLVGADNQKTRPEIACERVVYQSDGSLRHLHVTLTSVQLPDKEAAAWLLFAEEVTERQEAVLEVQKRGQQLQLALKAGRMGAFEWDITHNEFTWSEGHEQLHGFVNNAALPSLADITARIHPDDLSAMRRELVVHRRRPRADYTREYRVIWPDGSVHWLQLRARFLDFQDGVSHRVIGVAADIDDTKRIEEALRQTNRQLREALDQLATAQEHAIRQARLNALGRMAAGVAHDINNSLTPVLTYCELLQQQYELPEEAREWTEFIFRGIRDTAERIRRLNHFYRSHGSRESQEILDPGELIREVVEFTRPRWQNQALKDGRRITVETDVQESLRVRGDAPLLRAVITNLLFNSVDAIENQGRIRISAHQNQGVVTVSVVDDGIGMSPEQIDRCTEPFFTTKTHGSGLGLFECLGIIRNHGGRLDVSSKPGQGTTVRFTLPAEPARAITDGEDGGERLSAAAQPSARAEESSGVTILCVDDDDQVARATAALLALLNVDVETASDGRHALQRLAERAFDLVICDQGLPEMDGLAVLKHIRKNWPELPVIMVSGWSLPATENGVQPDAFLQKPFSVDELHAIVRKFLRPQVAREQQAET